MRAWRIAAETRRYTSDDLSGAGAAKAPGRWNNDGEPVVYAADSIALAVLETAAHADPAGLPLNRFVVAIDIPDDIWSARQSLAAQDLPPAWSAIPAGQASTNAGSAWLGSLGSAILEVPSVIVPEERVILINPRHPDTPRISARTHRSCEYDKLFRQRDC